MRPPGSIQALAALEEPLQRAVRMVVTGLTAGRKLLICGNGGSASDATHLATEFLCRFQGDRRPYPALSLTANGEFLTAMGNDYHFDEIFARQVWGLGEPGDVLLGFTTSGKSRNVLRAIEEANKKIAAPAEGDVRLFVKVVFWLKVQLTTTGHEAS